VQVQLPPRRPSNFAALVAAANNTPSLVTVQLPPQRPATLVASIAPEPVMSAPPQPTRPAVAAAPALGLRTEPLPAAASAFAPQAPSSAGRIVPAAPKPAPLAPEAKDRKALDSLISQVAAASVSERVAPVAPPTVSSVTSVKTMTGRFDTAPQGPKDTSGFTGSIIRPLGQGFR
jgi:hypothetical protein